MSEFQRRTATYPGAIEAARRDYELTGAGYKRLSKKFGIPRTTIAFHAIKERWAKPTPLPSGASEGCAEARDVETAIFG